MAILLAQVSVKMVSANPKDTVVNTFHFLADTPGSTIYSAIQAELNGFYNLMRSHWPNTVAPASPGLKIYNLNDTIPRYPVLDSALTISGSVPNAPLPSEVALCLSFQGAKISGHQQARRRGRIYFGPCHTSDLDSTGRPSAGLRSDLAAAGAALLSSSNTATGWDWVVNSRAGEGAVTVHDGWVDNAFDIQRRRGLAPTTRNLF